MEYRRASTARVTRFNAAFRTFKSSIRNLISVAALRMASSFWFASLSVHTSTLARGSGRSVTEEQHEREAMPYLISFGAGLVVGLLYWLVRVHSPAPPLIALAGLPGIVIGEGAVPFVQTHLLHAGSRANVAPAANEQRSESAIDLPKQT
jgi:XapX domain-containing protein